MSRGLPVVAATVLGMVLLGYGVHRYAALRYEDRIADRLGVSGAPRVRWARTERLLRGLPGLGAVGRRADAAGGRLGVTDLVLLWAVLAYPVSRVASAFYGETAGRALTVVALPMASTLLLDGIAQRRRERVLAQLPDLVRHLAGGALAGLSLSGSLLHAAEDLGGPTAAELRRVVLAMELGVLPDTALEQLADRLRSADVDVLIGALVIQQRNGGDLVSLLSRLADGLEATRRAQREVRSITAGPTNQVYLVAFLALAIAALSNRVTDGGLERALRYPVTAVLVVVSSVLLMAAILVVRRVVRVEA